jgi:predicted nucleic acid-binding protein
VGIGYLSADAEQNIKALLANYSVIDMNQEIKGLTIEFKRKDKLKLPDAIIAATARHAQLALLTADKHFRTVSRVEIVLYEP